LPFLLSFGSYLLFCCIAVSSFFWFFIFCSVVLPFLLSFGRLSSVQLYCRFFFLLVLYLLFSCIAVSSSCWSFIFCSEEKRPKERRNGNTTEQKIKNQKKEETAIQLNRR
jgi:amino acid permease